MRGGWAQDSTMGRVCWPAMLDVAAHFSPSWVPVNRWGSEAQRGEQVVPDHPISKWLNGLELWPVGLQQKEGILLSLPGEPGTQLVRESPYSPVTWVSSLETSHLEQPWTITQIIHNHSAFRELKYHLSQKTEAPHKLGLCLVCLYFPHQRLTWSPRYVCRLHLISWI